MPTTRPRPQRGHLPPGCERYGKSVLGAPLLYFPATQTEERSGLIIAGTHGDENAAMVALSCALRTLEPQFRRHHVVLAVNPDGCQLGLARQRARRRPEPQFPCRQLESGRYRLPLEQQRG